jgi:hypothetical protein
MNLPDMHWLTTTGVIAGAAAIGAMWRQAAGFFKQLSGLLFYVNTVQGRTASAVSRHIKHHYRKLPSGVATIHTKAMNLKGYSVSAAVPYALPNGPSIWFGRHGLFIVSSSGSACTLVSPRLFSRPFQMIRQAVRDDLDIRNNADGSGDRFHVIKVSGSAGDPLRSGGNTAYAKHRAPEGAEIADSDAPDTFWSPEVSFDKSFAFDYSEFDIRNDREQAFRGLAFGADIEALLTDIQDWMDKRDWYRERSIPHRMGVQLVGPGGTGKSSLVKAVAQQLKIPLYQYHLNTLTDVEFMQEWDQMQTPCVVALEDFDTVFHGREAVTIHKSLSFECVLNQISGISAQQGILLFVTSNEPDKIDPAMGQIDANGRPTRPGRIDRILYMGNTSLEQRRKLATMVLDWAPDLIDKLVRQGENTTAAQFQSMCITAALRRLNGLPDEDEPETSVVDIGAVLSERRAAVDEVWRVKERQ